MQAGLQPGKRRVSWDITGNFKYLQVQCGRIRAREVHREAHFNPVWGGGGVEGVPAAACSQNELHSMVMSNLALKRFKPRLDGSF